MATKKQTKGKKISRPKAAKDLAKQKPNVGLVSDGQLLARMLRYKVLANLSHELQEALLVSERLNDIWDQVAPSDFHRVPRTPATMENLLLNFDQAEYLLTGIKAIEQIGLPDGYEIPPHMKSSEG